MRELLRRIAAKLNRKATPVTDITEEQAAEVAKP